MRFEVIFCDFIRQEVSGKQILVGVYSQDVVVAPTLPGYVSVSVFVKIWDLPKSDYVLHAGIIDSKGITQWSGEIGRISVTHEGFPANVFFGPSQFFLSSPGPLQLRVAGTSTDVEHSFDEQASTLFVASRN